VCESQCEASNVVCRLLEERVNRIKTMLAALQHGQIMSSNDQRMLDSVNEDLHWLLLITGLTNLYLICTDKSVQIIKNILYNWHKKFTFACAQELKYGNA